MPRARVGVVIAATACALLPLSAVAAGPTGGADSGPTASPAPSRAADAAPRGEVLRVNDRMAGFYPRRLWNRGFRRARLVQVFGEVVTGSAVPCADMGNGRRPAHRRAASIRGVRFLQGPRMRLRETSTATSYGYALRLLHRRALRYGGSGQC